MIKISIQNKDFCPGDEKILLQRASTEVGAVVEFTGCVRADKGQDEREIEGLFLEHYPGMTENSISQIVIQAFSQWPLVAVTVIHRVGILKPGENIVYVGVASSHRQDALECVGFIMDFLKNDVPIWKKSLYPDGSEWVEQKASDIQAKNAWLLHDGS